MKMHAKDIVSLIEIRNFLVGSIDNLNIKLSREEMKKVQNKITYLNQIILDNALSLDVATMEMYQPMKQSGKPILTRTSTEDTEVVAKRAIDLAGKVPEGVSLQIMDGVESHNSTNVEDTE